MDLSKVRRKKIQDRKRVIKCRSHLPSQKKKETFTSYSKYLSVLKERIARIERIIEEIKELADEQQRD